MKEVFSLKINCNAQLLNEACQNVQRVVTSKTTIPAMEGILLQAKDGKLTLTGYDLEVGIITTVDVAVVEEGAIVLNAKVLCDILRRLPAELVSIEADARQSCVIRCGDIEYKLVGIAADEYPELPTITEGKPVLMDSEMLGKMIHQTIFSVSTGDSKVIHNGIKFEVSENQIRLVAVDGFRLAIRTEPIQYNDEELNFVVPAKTLNEVSKLLDDNDVVQMNVAKRHILFEIGSYTVVSRLLDGEFLNYNAALPKSAATTVKVATKSFIESIERTSLLITDRLKSPLRCVFDENSIKISSSTTLGTAEDRLAAEIEGNRVEIGFNNRFLLDAFRACDCDEVVVSLNNSLSPITVTPAEGDTGRFLFMVLPVRLRGEK